MNLAKLFWVKIYIRKKSTYMGPPISAFFSTIILSLSGGISPISDP